MGLFYVTVLSSARAREVLSSYVLFSTRLAGPVCNWFGQHTSVTNNVISSNRFAVSVNWGCDGSESVALFVAAVLAFPAPFRRKIPGILLGALILAVLNLVRIVSLFLAGVYFPSAFEWMHWDVWPAVFIFLAVLLWIIWIQWALNAHPATSNDSG
jgi:exosortase H (IPTLxxWG-CTERM-specific)